GISGWNLMQNLNYAHEHGIPLIALNLPKEITRKVAEEGMEALTEEEKAQVPTEIDDSDATYRKRMKEIFGHHPHSEEQDFERFLQVQLLWDEGMAKRAADFLVDNPDKRMVVLAGIGHLENGYGIPDRVKRRIPVEGAIVLPWGSLEVRPGVSDFLLFPEDAKLPPKGYMGVILGDDEGAGAGVGIEELIPNGAAEKAGMKKGDRVLSVNGQATNKSADIKIILFDKKPGEKISLQLRRKRLLFGEKELTLDLELAN
ncbi:ChaN family lipoprotein, partial [Pseudomonadota bacterium]